MTFLRGNDAFLVAPAEAGAHAMIQEWIPACAEKHPSPWTKGLGGMTNAGGNDRVVRLREHVGDGDDVVNRIPGHVAAE